MREYGESLTCIPLQSGPNPTETNQLENYLERHIQNGIKELIRGRTSIIIAHRLSTLKHVDKILVLKEGQIKEYGTQKTTASAEESATQQGIYFI